MTQFFQDAHAQDTDRDVSLLAQDQFLREVRWLPFLERDEQQQLYEQVRQGVIEQGQLYPNPHVLHQAAQARTRLAESYQRVIVRLALPFARNSVRCELLDFVNEGTIGFLLFLDRLDTVDIVHGAIFHTLALAAIRGAMLGAFRDNYGVVRIQKHTVTLINKVAKVEQDLFEALGHEPTYQEIALAMQLPLAKVLELVAYRERRRVESLERLAQERETPDFLTMVSVFEQEEQRGNAQVQEMIEVALTTLLTHRQQEIVRLRYGFDEGPSPVRSLDAVAQVLGVGKNVIWRAEKRAKRNLYPVLASCFQGQASA